MFGGEERLWTAVAQILDEARLDGIRAHKLGPLAARFLRVSARPVPPVLAVDERGAAIAVLTSNRLLERVRAACDGPLVLMKGPEVGRRYPGSARAFGDLDVLVPDPPAVQRSLLRSGFTEVGGLVPDAHLMPLKSPDLGLRVEVHSRPSWPKRLLPPDVGDIFDRAVPSASGIDGVLAPADADHALIVAAHAWKENPLGTLRDLVDVAALAVTQQEHELDALAEAWRIERLWHATHAALEAVLERRPLPLPLRVWARHLESVRERTLLENHLRGWLHGYSKAPFRVALADTRDALRKDFMPRGAESWSMKLRRVLRAIRHPGRTRRIGAHE